MIENIDQSQNLQETNSTELFRQNLSVLAESAPELYTIAPEEIIELHSQTFKTATKFFPAEMAADIRKVYAFVRVPDDMVDVPIEERSEKNRVTFEAYYGVYKHVIATPTEDGQLVKSGIPVVDEFAAVSQKYGFASEWAEAFFAAMRQDFDGVALESEEELLNYTYGSAAVIGLMCAKVFGITDEQQLSYAKSLGDAFQLINFIRDWKNDLATLGRNYFTKDDYKLLGIDYPTAPEGNLSLSEADFDRLIKFQLSRFENWLNEGLKGIPAVIHQSSRAGMAVLTASILYEDIAKEIFSNPQLIKEGELKPDKTTKVKALLNAAGKVISMKLNHSQIPQTTPEHKINLTTLQEP